MSYQTLQKLSSFCLIALLSLALYASPTLADVVNYSAQAGNDVTYNPLYEESVTDPVPLYGSPTVSYNTLMFSPMSFQAASQLGSPATDETTGTLHTTISAAEGAAIATIRIFEQGDCILGGTGTAATTVSVTTSIDVAISEVDGVALSSPINFIAYMAFSPNANGQFNLMVDQGDSSWTGEATIDIASLVAGRATKVELAITNTLSASSEAASTALINKKVFGVESTPLTVPEPTGLFLLVSGVLALLPIRRRAA